MKRLMSILVIVCMVLSIPLLSSAKVVKIDHKTIMLTDEVLFSDFEEFLVATAPREKTDWTFVIHSPGGNAITCVAIMNRMREMQREGHTFTTINYGAAMSAGTYIWLMGDKRIAYEGSTFLFHGAIAQMNSINRVIAEENHPKAYNTMVRMDKWIEDRLVSLGMTRKMADFWLNSGPAQFMSAETAWNTGLATEYVKTDG